MAGRPFHGLRIESRPGQPRVKVQRSNQNSLLAIRIWVRKGEGISINGGPNKQVVQDRGREGWMIVGEWPQSLQGHQQVVIDVLMNLQSEILRTCACGGVHPVSPMELTTFHTEPTQTRDQFLDKFFWYIDLVLIVVARYIFEQFGSQLWRLFSSVKIRPGESNYLRMAEAGLSSDYRSIFSKK